MGVPAFFAIVETYTFNRMAGRPFTLTAIVLRESATWVTYAVFTPVILRIAAHFPLDASTRWRNIFVHTASAVGIGAIAAASATLATSISRSAMLSMQTMTIPVIYLDWFLGGLPLEFLAYFLVVGFAHAIRDSGEARQRREDALRLETQLVVRRRRTTTGAKPRITATWRTWRDCCCPDIGRSGQQERSETGRRSSPQRGRGWNPPRLPRHLRTAPTTSMRFCSRPQ